MADAPDVIGLDLSLTSTGIATADRTYTVGCALPKAATQGERCERLAAIRDEVLKVVGPPGWWLHDDPTPLVVMEGFSFGSPQGATDAGGLGWLIRVTLHEAGVPFAVVPPNTLKLYATGKGNAGKDDMKLAALSRAGLEFTGKGSSDECDAWWLRALGLDHLGAPVVEMPAANRAALEKVEWPDA